MTHKKDLPHAPDTPLILCCSQYSRNLAVRRVRSAAMPRPGSAPTAPPWSSGAPERPGDTMCVPGCLHSPPEWPHSASSPASGPAPAVPGYLHMHGKIPASGAGCVGRSPWPPDSLPGDTQRPSPPRPSPGEHRWPCQSQGTIPPPAVRFAAGCPGPRHPVHLRTTRRRSLPAGVPHLSW